MAKGREGEGPLAVELGQRSDGLSESTWRVDDGQSREASLLKTSHCRPCRIQGDGVVVVSGQLCHVRRPRTSTRTASPPLSPSSSPQRQQPHPAPSSLFPVSPRWLIMSSAIVSNDEVRPAPPGWRPRWPLISSFSELTPCPSSSSIASFPVPHPPPVRPRLIQDARLSMDHPEATCVLSIIRALSPFQAAHTTRTRIRVQAHPALFLSPLVSYRACLPFHGAALISDICPNRGRGGGVCRQRRRHG